MSEQRRGKSANKQDTARGIAETELRRPLARLAQSGRAFADAMLRASSAERRRYAEEREQLLERERAAHAEAEKARQETRAILDSISDGFFALDRKRRFVYVNRKAKQLWGKPQEDLLGKDIWEEFPQAVGSESYRQINRAMEEGVTTEFEAISLDSGEWISGRAYPSAEGLSVYFQIITKRKMTEEALRQSEERLQLALDAAQLGRWELVPKTGEFFTSPLCNRHLGLSPDAQPTHEDHFVNIHPDDHEMIYQRLGQAEKSGEFEVEYRTLHPGGAVRWIISRARVVHDRASASARFIGMTLDVTELREAEEERARLHALESAARAEATERERISRELHDRVAHAMGVVHQSLQLYEALRESAPEVARAKIGLAQEMTKEAMGLTRDLSSKLRTSEIEDDLHSAMSSLLEATVPPGLACTFSVEGEETLVPPHVREQLFVILREGVRNAVSHSGASHVETGIRVSSKDVVGYVEDDGRGFVEEKGLVGGGIRSMRERANLVGGTLELSSEPGVGTTIKATIPLK